MRLVVPSPAFACLQIDWGFIGLDITPADKYEKSLDTEDGNAVFETGDNLRRHNIAGHARDKDVANCLVENQFRRHAGISTGEHPSNEARVDPAVYDLAMAKSLWPEHVNRFFTLDRLQHRSCVSQLTSAILLAARDTPKTCGLYRC
jgi:hypothetical protein